MRDSTVGAHHGTTHGAMTAGQSVEGRIGRALNFDGVNDAVEMPHHSNLSLTNNFTYKLWFNPARLDQVNTYILNKNNRPGIIYEYVNDQVEYMY